MNQAAAEQQPWPFQEGSHGSLFLSVMECKWNKRRSGTDGHFVEIEAFTIQIFFLFQL